MGNDGGHIPKRSDLVRTKRETSIQQRKQILQERVKSCALTNTPLSKPVGICRLGLLYNKFHFLQILMNNSVPNKFKHLKKMGDVKEVVVTFNPSAKFPLYCPLTSKPVNGANSFVCFWECGCLLYEKMAFSLSGVPYCMEKIEEIKRTEGPRAKSLKKKFKCPNCGGKFSLRKVVGLNLSVGDIEGQLRSRNEQESYWRRKKEKRKRREKTEHNRVRRGLDVEMISLGYKPVDSRKMGLTKLGEGNQTIQRRNPETPSLRMQKKNLHLENDKGLLINKKRENKSEIPDFEKGNQKFRMALKKAHKFTNFEKLRDQNLIEKNENSEMILENNKKLETNFSKNEEELGSLKLGKRENLNQPKKLIPKSKNLKKIKNNEKSPKNQIIEKKIKIPEEQILQSENLVGSELKSGQSIENLNEDRIETENENEGKNEETRKNKNLPKNQDNSSEFEKIIERDNIDSKSDGENPKTKKSKNSKSNHNKTEFAEIKKAKKCEKKSKNMRTSSKFGIPGPLEILRKLFHKKAPKADADELAMNNTKHGLR